MSDLRERLGRLFACRCDPAWTERRLHAPDCVEELGDDAIAEVAEWLHRKAADTRAVADVLPATDEREAIGAAKMLDALADALTQKEPTP